jgi:hypothetical protein
MKTEAPKMAVVHKLTGEKLTIKKIYGSVCTCYTETLRNYLWNETTNVIVCSMDNLIIDNYNNNQTKLF